MSRVKKGQTKKMGKNDLVTLSLLTVCVAVLVLALGLHKAHAVSSRSDPGLDSAVKVLSGSDNGSDDGARAVAIQSDGKIVVIGFSDANRDFDFALARYNPDGSLDTSFGGDGKVLTDFGGSDDEAFGVAIQADGRIVAAGFSDVNRDFDFAIVRYNPDGGCDNTFGSNGIVTTNFETNSEHHDNGGCAIGGPVQFETGISNVLIPLAPAIAIGLRALIRRRERQGREKK